MLAWRTSPVWGVWQIPVLQRTGIGMHCRWDDTGIEPSSGGAVAVSCLSREGFPEGTPATGRFVASGFTGPRCLPSLAQVSSHQSWQKSRIPSMNLLGTEAGFCPG